MKIGLAQIDCEPGDLPSNCAKFAEYAEQAKGEGCEVVIFPEMSDTGYIPSVIAECAATWPGLPIDTVREAAVKNSLPVLCGLSERTGDAVYNTLVFVDASGQIRGRYRKTHLFVSDSVREDRVFSPGHELTVVEIGDWKWGLTICYELRFPELYRALALEGAQVLLNIAAWPASRPTHWELLAAARAIENQAFFVGVDRVGLDGRLKMNGHSRVVTPRGDLLCDGSADSEQLLVAELDGGLIDEFRRAIPAVSTRRPELYGSLIDG